MGQLCRAARCASLEACALALQTWADTQCARYMCIIGITLVSMLLRSCLQLCFLAFGYVLLLQKQPASCATVHELQAANSATALLSRTVRSATRLYAQHRQANGSDSSSIRSEEAKLLHRAAEQLHQLPAAALLREALQQRDTDATTFVTPALLSTAQRIAAELQVCARSMWLLACSARLRCERLWADTASG